MSRVLVRSHIAQHEESPNAEYDGTDTYEVYSCDGGQYEVECYGRNYNTDTAEMLGYMPVFGGHTVLYKDVDNGYFVMSFSGNDRPPGFSRLTETAGKLWEEGLEKYWAGKRV